MGGQPVGRQRDDCAQDHRTYHVDQKGGDGEGIQAWRYGEACPVSGRRPERATRTYHRQQGCAAPERS